LCPSSELLPVGEQIKIKREELAKRKYILAEAHQLLEVQRDDANEVDMLLHAERYITRICALK
jgi:DNA polymerase sigma